MGQHTTSNGRTPEHNGRRRALTATAVVAILMAASIATAQWMASGTGTGYAKAVNVQPLTTESVTVTGDLYPGGTGSLSLRVRNPNPFPTTVQSVEPNGPITSDSAACNQDGHGVTFAGVEELAVEVGASSSVSFDLAEAVTMSAESADACQGATFTIPVSLNGGTGASPPTTVGNGPAQPSEGEPCDDGNPDTANDTVIGGDCVGEYQEYTYYVDNDSDGHGDPTLTQVSNRSTADAGFVVDNTDCNDADDGVNPSAEEIPGNDVDENCDGIVE